MRSARSASLSVEGSALRSRPATYSTSSTATRNSATASQRTGVIPFGTNSSAREPAIALTVATTKSGRKLSRIRAMSSQRKYAVSGIRSWLTNETTNDRRISSTSVAASHH